MPKMFLIALAALPALFVSGLFLAGQISRLYPDSSAAPWAMSALLFAATILLAMGNLIHLVAHWNRPMTHLRRELEQIRAGGQSIESLSHIRGGLQPLVGDIQELLRDLRRQRADQLVLESEARLRVANCTDALERRMAALRQQAIRDPLTGLYNRRMLDESLGELLEQMTEETGPLYVLMIDVDHFKSLNDQLGHPAGDEFLRNVGQLIRSTIRAHDMAFRYGGDEFVIVITKGGRLGGQRLSQRLVSLVDAAARTIHASPSPRLSIGLAGADEVQPRDAAALLKLADERLYETKIARRPVHSAPMLIRTAS